MNRWVTCSITTTGSGKWWLTSLDGTPGAGTNQTDYVIDTAGNWSRVTNIIPTTSTNSTVYVVNNLNQYTNIGGQTYYYTNGNYWENSSNSFFYDYESRLICSFVGGVTITNTYDVLGRHVGRKHSAIWTRYYYAGWQLIEERDRLGNVAANHVYGVGLDEPIRMTRNGTNYYYHTDGLGSVTAITDGNGTLIEQYSYDVYGLPTIYDGQTNVISASAIGNPWLFQGRYWEPDALLYNYRYRYYHPGMGRFLQPDPAFYVPTRQMRGDARGSVYEFLRNSPSRFVDPSGKNAYVINYDECLGHSFFAIDAPEGGAIIFDLWSRHWREKHHLLNSARALILDEAYIDVTRVTSLSGFVGDLASSPNTVVDIRGIAVGTPVDDTLMIDSLMQRVSHPGFYSLLLFQHCHTMAEAWFNEYTAGGQYKNISEFTFLTPPNPQIRFPAQVFFTRSYLAQSLTIR